MLTTTPSIPFYLILKINAQALRRLINNLNFRKEKLHFTNLSFSMSQMCLKWLFIRIIGKKEAKNIVNTLLIF